MEEWIVGKIRCEVLDFCILMGYNKVLATVSRNTVCLIPFVFSFVLFGSVYFLFRFV